MLLAPAFSRQDEAMIIRVLDRLARVLGYLPFAAMRKLLRFAVNGSPLPPDRLTGLVSELQKNDPEFMRRGIHDYPRYLDRGHDRAPPLALGENPGRPVRRARELATLLRAAVAGPRVVLVEGEPGVEVRAGVGVEADRAAREG